MRIIISENQLDNMKYKLKSLIDEEGLIGAANILDIPVYRLIELGAIEDYQSVIQDLINYLIDYLKTECEEMNANSEEISFDACDFLESLVSVQVSNINQTDKSFIVQIIIKYESIFAVMDEESFIRELQYKLKKYIPNIKLQVENSINIKDRQW
jgi:N-methylhydantoinase B/oxoprolinase/acetone carboxylase alpha subunit